MNDLLGRYAGVEFSTPAQAWDWLENNRHLSDREKRRAASWIEQWETSEGHKFRERLKTRSEQIKTERQRNRERIEEGQRRIAEVERAMKTGRMTSGEGLKEITRLAHQRNQCLAVQETLRQATERWEADADAPISDYLTDVQRRFPAANRATKQTLTLGYLQGDEDSPFRSRS
jgi:chromosome segregation ATPase